VVAPMGSWWTTYLTDEDRELFDEVDRCRDRLHELMARKRKAYFRAVRRGERAREREQRKREGGGGGGEKCHAR